MSTTLRPLRILVSRQTLTGLGLVLAAVTTAPVAQASGWDCRLDARGEWMCHAGTGITTEETGAEVTATDGDTPDSDTAESGTQDSEAVTAERTDSDSDFDQTTDTSSPKHQVHISDDWVPLDQLTPEQKQQLADKQKEEAIACCGIYVDPTESGDQTDPDNAEITAHADESYTDINSETTELKGNVQVSQGYRYLRADAATLRRSSQEVALNGNVALREPGLLVIGDRADIQLGEKTAQMENAEYLLHKAHVRGTAQSLSRSDTGVVAMTDASYSYCPVGSDQWTLNARTLTLDPNDSQGRARDVTLRVAGVPVFYTPYLQFPLGNQRMSGFLVPSFGVGDDGFEIATPYYFNLAPNYDLTLTPRYISERGLMLSATGRYMTEHTRGSITASILPGDKKTDPGIDSDRWLFSARQDGADKKWDSMVDYSAVSDSQYFHDLGRSGVRNINTAQLRKEAQFNFRPDDNWRLGVVAKQFQTLRDSVLTSSAADLIALGKVPPWYNLALERNQLIDPHQVMPSLFADGNYSFDNGLVVNLHQSLTRFDHRKEGDLQNSVFFGTNTTELPVIDPFTNAPTYLGEREFIAGNRFNLDYNVALPLRSDSAFLTPKIGVRHVSQQLDETTLYTPDSNPSASAMFASVDTGLIFERDTNLFGNNYKQTLEPRLFYYYSNPGDQDDTYNFDSNALSFSYAQLFRDYRLAGEDYIDDANQVSVGVSTRLLSPSTGRELLRVGIGQAYYLDKRDVVLAEDPQTADYERNRSRSSIVLEAAARLTREWDIRTETLWDENRAQRERQSLALRYRDGEGRLFNTGYQYLERADEWVPEFVPGTTAPLPVIGQGHYIDRTVEQYYVSAVYPLNSQWNLIGHWNRDVTNSRNLEAIAGVEYNSCCWAVRLMARQWVTNRYFVSDADMQDIDHGIFLQFQLKSLGNVGDDVESTLSDSIFGYKDRYKTID